MKNKDTLLSMSEVGFDSESPQKQWKAFLLVGLKTFFLQTKTRKNVFAKQYGCRDNYVSQMLSGAKAVNFAKFSATVNVLGFGCEFSVVEKKWTFRPLTIANEPKSEKTLFFGDDTERLVADFLRELKIKFIHESESRGQKLDFYLPDFDTFIEVKRFASQRTQEQLSGHDNIILVQGMKSIKFITSLFADGKVDS